MKFEYQGQPVELEPEVRKYLKDIRKKLLLPSKVKQSVLSDLLTGMLARAENGESMRIIMADMGTPARVAEGINKEMDDLVYVKNPWRWVCLAVSVLCAIFLVVNLMYIVIEHHAISAIGGNDGPTQIFITTSSDSPVYYSLVAIIIMALGIIGFAALSRSHKKRNS